MKKSLFFSAILLSVMACTRNQEIDIPDANLSLIAKTESSTDSRTVVEGGTHVFWEPGDEIMVFTGEKSAKFSTDITASSATAVFKGTFGEETWPEDMDLWAVYPYSEEAMFDGETITTTLPSEQIAREGSFGKDMNLAIAHSTGTTLQFYNVGGGIRFSVTEDGIKKVMFEGLGGEIVSGKVKIGFSEDGKPVVQEVSGGSQFITLLPPDGQDAFQKETWYYIVAIPGSLESGYKLRFYKDTDYARKVSEKAVQIKRSIYGNIEKADEGLDYETPSLPFPHTEQEWKTSDDITIGISSSVNRLICDYEPEELQSAEHIIHEISQLENVDSVKAIEDGSRLLIKQNNGVYINLILSLPQEIDEDDDSVMGYASRSDSIAPKNKASLTIQTLKSDISAVAKTAGNKKAILLSPFQDDYPDIGPVVDVEFLDTSLDGIGYTLVNVPPDKLKLKHFSGETLSQYELVLIASHGGDRFTCMNGAAVSTVVNTGIEVGTLDEDLDRSLLAMAICEGKTTYYVTVPWLNATTPNPDSFSESMVYFGSCRSYKDDDFASFFESQHAGFLGHKNIMAVQFDNLVIHSLVTLLTQGMSFSTAVECISRDPWAKAEQDRLSGGTLWFFDLTAPSFPWRVSPSKLKKVDSSLHLIDSKPVNLNHQVNESRAHLTWDLPHLNGEFQYKVHLNGAVYDSRTLREYTAGPLTPGDYTWYVVAELLFEGEVVESFQSGEDHFTVEEQLPDPPQVETFPASVDAEKAFLSGMVTNRSLDGLETGFYYYKLTAQEESMQLSESDKIRLVMGGKKVLSVGDYKDYFGVNLTDIEQESTYLFVAYATDEHNQMGKGEVLSFTTGSPSVHVTSVSLNKTSLELSVGNTATLVATVLPENASNKKVTWSSSDDSKATVSSAGVVKGIAQGDVVITVTTEDGGKTASCHVSVTQSSVHVESVSLNKADLELTVGNSATLVATVLPDNAANKSVTWSSSNSSKASVSSTGVVTGVAEGSAVITATTVDGGKTASCFVTVHQSAQPDPEPRLSVSTSRLDFGNQVKFTPESKSITITNSGTGTLQITSISKTNNYGDLFQLSGWTSGGAIAAGASKTITVSFQPLEEKYYEETLTIVSSNSVSDKQATVAICGTGISESGDALIQVSCDELDWGDVEIGNQVTKSFSVMNTGSATLDISSIKIVATDNTVNPSYYSITPNSSCTVSSGSSLAFSVTFIPESECGYYAMVSIKSNASNATQGTSTVWLSGVGVKSSSPSVSAPEIVDLGLSVKWASFNLGATKPEEYGEYYYWGETEPMAGRAASLYKFLNGAQALTKYNTDPNYTYLGLGIIDNKTKLDLEDDAAYVNLGGNWRMPTDAEWTELRENCSWTWTTENGVDGYKVISQKPGYTDKWIFMPAPGERRGTDEYNVGYYGYYWSSSLYTDDPLCAYSIFYSPVYVGRHNDPRYAGISIRPVYDDK